MNNYFCCCDECGSIEWIDDEDESEGINYLKLNGELLFQKDYDLKRFNNGFPVCAQCENNLKLIPFKHVNMDLRKRIARMNEEDRINWVKSYWTYRVLEKE